MGGIDFTLALVGAAFLLASWVDTQVGDKRPSSPTKSFVHCFIGVAVLQASSDQLDQRRDRIGQDLGVGPGILGADLHGRRGDLRVLLDRQSEEGDDAEQDRD